MEIMMMNVATPKNCKMTYQKKMNAEKSNLAQTDIDRKKLEEFLNCIDVKLNEQLSAKLYYGKFKGAI